MKIRVLFIPVFFATCASAQAAKVQNLTDAPQAIVLLDEAEPHMVEIAPGRSFERTGALRMRYRNHELYVEENMEYAIWPNNVIGPQKVKTYNFKNN